jgi:metal-responsive CopG/Arc/MetJ family transcriptional regulator
MPLSTTPNANIPRAKQIKKRQARKVKMRRITLNIYDGLLDMIDEAAEQDFTTRSDIIRTALLWYLRPQGRELAQTDPKLILKTLQKRDSQAKMRKMLKDLDML